MAGIIRKNANRVDRAVRVLVGAPLLAIAFIGPQTPFGWVGLVPLVTGFAGWCPIYKMTGHSTLNEEIDHGQQPPPERGDA